MGRTRRQRAAREQQRTPGRQGQAPASVPTDVPTEAQIAAAIAAILGGAVAVASVEAAISFLLIPIVRPFGLLEGEEGEIADGTARLVTEGVPSPPGVGLDSPIGRMHIRNLLRRAQYAIKASRRVARDVGAGASIREAFTKEAPLYRSHRRNEKERSASADLARAALRKWGRNVTWLHGDPKEPRPHHLAADGGQFDLLAPPATVGGVLPGELPNCLLGDVVAEARGIRRGFSRYYEGEVVHLATDLGSRMTVTPNHPVLTTKGWVGAGSLMEGDHVIGGSFGEGVQRLPDGDEDYGPAPIQEITESIRKAVGGRQSTVPTTAEHFHGDGMDSYVNVVGPEGLLGDEVNASLLEPSGHDLLGGGDVQAAFLSSDGALGDTGRIGADPSGGLVRGSRVASVFFGGALGDRKAAGLADASTGNPGFVKPPGYSGTGDGEGFGNGLFALPATIAPSDFTNVQVSPATPWGLEKAALIQGGPELAMRDAKLVGGIPIPSAFKVTVHRVLKKSVSRFSGHVYNLQTDSGWYLADTIITHNCTCTIGAPRPGARQLT